MHTAADPALDAIINEAMVNGGIPGIVLFFGRGDVVVCRNAYGYAVLKPRPRLATETTLFDLASLTKPVGNVCGPSIKSSTPLLANGPVRVRVAEPDSFTVPLFVTDPAICNVPPSR